MSLQTHTFFLDTTHAAPQGPGSWRFQLQDPIEVRDSQVVHVDDVTFRNSFPTVDVFSNKLYLLTQYLAGTRKRLISRGRGTKSRAARVSR